MYSIDGLAENIGECTYFKKCFQISIKNNHDICFLGKKLYGDLFYLIKFIFTYKVSCKTKKVTYAN